MRWTQATAHSATPWHQIWELYLISLEMGNAFGRYAVARRKRDKNGTNFTAFDEDLLQPHFNRMNDQDASSSSDCEEDLLGPESETGMRAFHLEADLVD